MKKRKILKEAVVLLITVALISGAASAIVTPGNSTNMNVKKVISTVIDTADRDYQVTPLSIQTQINEAPPGRGVIVYASNLHTTPDSLVDFDSATPGTLNYINDISSTDFIAGAAWNGDTGEWWACEYSTSNSNIWTINENTGAMALKGGSGVGLNGLAYHDGTLYGCSSLNFYTVSMVNGAATLVGAFGADVSVMIGIACASDGTCYGEDLGTDKLYSIVTSTGAATEIGPLGVNLNYAQDIGMDKDNNILYSTGYKGSTAGGGTWGTLNLTDGSFTAIGDFPIGDLGAPSEVAGVAIPYTTSQCEPSIDVEKEVWDEKNKRWVDADTENEALDIPICHNATFRITITNTGDCPLYNITVHDKMHDTLEFLGADPEPTDFAYDPPYYYMTWYIDEMDETETVEIIITAHVKGPEPCTTDSNHVQVTGICLHGITVTDEDWCWVHAITGGKALDRPFLRFLQSYPNLFRIIEKLLQRLGLQ
jgi:hypothetical protein